MTKYVQHDMKVTPTPEEAARQAFMSSMRMYVLHDLANGMRTAYEAEVEPKFERKNKRAPKNGVEVHRAIKKDPTFKFYSSMRCNAQEMVFRSILPTVERDQDALNKKAKALSRSKKVAGTVETDPKFKVPRSVSAVDVHRMPGNYDTEYGPDDVTQGAVYDNGISVFSMGFFGENLDDIGGSISMFIKNKYSKFAPKRILDMGCTIGHNTVPWAKMYPKAEVHGIDVGAPVVRYGHARAQAAGVPVHFHQQNAEATDFEDGSFDMIFSSMFLHEVPKKGIKKVFKEARRLLKPGGLMLHMELPPNKMLGAYDSFYLDWDAYYNKEPFYKPFRDMDPQAVCAEAGFAKSKFVQYIIPSLGQYGEKVVKAAVKKQSGRADDQTGRFAAGIHWYCFGAWK
jgi:ubiquinone/menaquinone biosynthesis C-methylase UbiE